MRLKKLAVVAAIAVVVGFGAVGREAQAGVMAQAELDITNFALGTYNGSFTPFSFDQFSSLSFLTLATNNASLNGIFTASAASSTTFVPTVDAVQACLGTCGGQNNFSPAAVPPVASYSRSDSLVANSPIAGVGVPVGARNATIAETSLPGTAGASGSAGTQIQTTMTFRLTLPVTDFAISFHGSEYLRAWTSANSAAGSSAGASISWSFVLKDGNTTLFAWEPDSTTGGPHTGLTEISDPCDLNMNASASFNSPLAPFTCGGGDFLAVANGVTLAANHSYGLTVAQNVLAQAISIPDPVGTPEPASLALLGSGLLVLGFSRRRKAQTRAH